VGASAAPPRGLILFATINRGELIAESQNHWRRSEIPRDSKLRSEHQIRQHHVSRASKKRMACGNFSKGYRHVRSNHASPEILDLARGGSMFRAQEHYAFFRSLSPDSRKVCRDASIEIRMVARVGAFSRQA